MVLKTLRLSASFVVVRIIWYFYGIKMPIIMISAKKPAIEIKIVLTIICFEVIKVVIIWEEIQQYEH